MNDKTVQFIKPRKGNLFVKDRNFHWKRRTCFVYPFFTRDKGGREKSLTTNCWRKFFFLIILVDIISVDVFSYFFPLHMKHCHQSGQIYCAGPGN